MKKPIPSLLLAAFLSSAAYATPGPIRVLYPGNEGSPAAKHCAVLMRELGRDAIWLDYTADTAAVTKEWLGKFDAVLLDGRATEFRALAGWDQRRFADKLNLPTSLVFANGGIIVSQAARFLFLKDTDGDDKADVREIIMQSWGVQDTQAQASNLHYGLDNWLYGCVGYSGFKGVVGGKMRDFAMGTYRFKADGSTLEFLHQFSNNSWAQSINAAGDQFGGTANNAPIFYGGIPAGVTPAGMRLMMAKRINIEDKAHAITPNFRQVDVMGGYTAAAGSAFIYSSNLPARFQGKAMVCEPTMKLISLIDVQPDGAGYVAKDGFNLVASSDEWMSPVFSEVGPDDAVWFADWENFIIQHNPTPSAERAARLDRSLMGSPPGKTPFILKKACLSPIKCLLKALLSLAPRRCRQWA
ncbi:MAG: rane-bound dehydrogenase protein [Chthoniobacteraceae bacterium]|nr:rane-bound dehydrogenase protein [Chthoniobacteraceae bacterium]